MTARPGGPAEVGLPGRETLPAPGSAVHLMGVAGAGMRGLAVLLAEAGFQVSGCDRSGEVDLPELRAREIPLHGEHDPAHLEDIELLVRSSAVPEDAPELVAARRAGIPVLKRARALGALVNGRRLVGLAGTHGKTTITAMTGRALEAAGLEPVVVVGGEVHAWDGFARPGGGEVAVVEADEFDRSFLELDPSLAVISSLEPEHLESYGTEEALRDAFAEFSRRALPRDGVLCCADDPGAYALARRLGWEPEAAGGKEKTGGKEKVGGKEKAGTSVLTYGFAEGADYRVEAGPEGPDGTRRCHLLGPEGPVDFLLAIPGDHNIQNAVAALVVALRLGADPRSAASALAGFAGVGRRLEVLAERSGVTVVDDYAHHPTEVRASLTALHARWPGRRLVAVFQPHLYSRTRDFAAEFGSALTTADRALVLPIYPSREAPIPGVDSHLVVAAAGSTVRDATADEALAEVRRLAAYSPDQAASATASGREASVVVFMGAGDVTALAHRAAGELTRRQAGEVGAGGNGEVGAGGNGEVGPGTADEHARGDAPESG